MRLAKPGVSDQVAFLGFVPPDHLQSLYALTRLLIFPSLFEGWGFPVTEAMRAGVPVACSNATSLPEQAAGSALLFDPTNVEEIAEAVERIWGQRLVASGTQRCRPKAGSGIQLGRDRAKSVTTTTFSPLDPAPSKKSGKS